MKEYFRDWLIANGIAIPPSVMISGNPLETFMISIFIESGIALILGGLYGAIFSSALFHDKIIRKKEFNIEEVKREVKIGKRFAILGLLLFVESILIATLI